jgi:pimeloyl-ACP methyl ester carboxylesterase
VSGDEAPGGWQQSVEVDGFRGCYTVTGAGEPLVLLASMLVRARPYRQVVRRLASRFRVFALDMPGCGRATRLGRAWSFEQYARWLDGAIAKLQLSNVTLVGHSNSAGTALVAGATFPPGRLRRIVLADTVGADESPSYWRVLLARGLDGIIEPGLSFTGWHHIVYNVLLHTRSFFGQVKASIEQDLRPYAPRVRVPALLAWGARDHTMPPRCARVLRSLLPRSQLYVCPTGSHDWIITHADEFALAVFAFVDATRPAIQSAP